jgi:drug/metabolite transporter (DMT)-like permease
MLTGLAGSPADRSAGMRRWWRSSHTQVLSSTPIGGFALSTLIFGDALSADVIISIVLIVAGILVTLRR